MYCVFNTLNFYEIFKILRCVKKKKKKKKTAYEDSLNFE